MAMGNVCIDEFEDEAEVPEAASPETAEAEAAIAGAAAATAPPLRNFKFEEVTKPGKNGQPVTEVVIVARTLPEVAAELWARSDGWPRVCDGNLFVPGADGDPRFLGKPAEVFAFIGHDMPVDWSKGKASVTKEEFVAYLQGYGEQYDAIERLPHWPPMPRTYYAGPPLPNEGHGALDTFIDYFNPLKSLDRQLLIAALVTPFWGGEPGSRPAFLFAGPRNAPGQGRGIGKTTVATVFANEICGGYLDIRPSEDMGKIKERALTLEARTKRVFMLDNIKSYKFSWADFEGFVTSPVISGRQMYKGDASRPNTVCWYLTINGASLSKDIAQRVVPVFLAPPTYSTTWGAEVRAFARAHRKAILADIRDLLLAPTLSVTAKTRFGPWEQGVLSKLDNPAGCATLILKRQTEMDEDSSDRDTVLAEFRGRIAMWLKHDGKKVDQVRVFLPSRVAATWLSAAMNTKYDTTRANAFLKALGLPELLFIKHNGYPGFKWTGSEWSGKKQDLIEVISGGVLGDF